MRKIVRKIDLDKKTGMEVIFFLKDVFILVDKSLLILLADDTKELANTGNNRVVNYKDELITQSNLKHLGSRKQKRLEFSQMSMDAPGTRNRGPIYRTRAVSGEQ